MKELIKSPNLERMAKAGLAAGALLLGSSNATAAEAKPSHHQRSPKQVAADIRHAAVNLKKDIVKRHAVRFDNQYDTLGRIRDQDYTRRSTLPLIKEVDGKLRYFTLAQECGRKGLAGIEVEPLPTKETLRVQDIYTFDPPTSNLNKLGTFDSRGIATRKAVVQLDEVNHPFMEIHYKDGGMAMVPAAHTFKVDISAESGVV